MADRRAVTGAVAEPIGKTPEHRKFDFSARSRATVDDAERYTRFVAVMRRALLAAGLILIGLVAGYSLMPRQSQRLAMTFEKMGVVSGDLSMVAPKLHGTDNEGNPFTVTADRAVQNSRNLRQAKLFNVEADMNTKDGQWFTVAAPHGALDANSRQLLLSGTISLYTDQGYEVHTNLVQIDLAKGIAIGPHHVTGQGPTGTFDADRFRIEKITDPCAREREPGSHPLRSHRSGGPASVCHAPLSKVSVGKPKPVIYLIGNVHMQIYRGALKKKKA